MSLRKVSETLVPDITIPVQAAKAWAGIWETYFQISMPGTYEFRATQQQSTSLAVWVDQYEVIEALCKETETTGTLVHSHLGAGDHDIKVLFVGEGWEDNIKIEYSGPDTNNQWIIMEPPLFVPGVVCHTDAPEPECPKCPSCPSSLAEEDVVLASMKSDRDDDNALDKDGDGIGSLLAIGKSLPLDASDLPLDGESPGGLLQEERWWQRQRERWQPHRVLKHRDRFELRPSDGNDDGPSG